MAATHDAFVAIVSKIALVTDTNYGGWPHIGVTYGTHVNVPRTYHFPSQRSQSLPIAIPGSLRHNTKSV